MPEQAVQVAKSALTSPMQGTHFKFLSTNLPGSHVMHCSLSVLTTPTHVEHFLPSKYFLPVQATQASFFTSPTQEQVFDFSEKVKPLTQVSQMDFVFCLFEVQDAQY